MMEILRILAVGHRQYLWLAAGCLISIGVIAANTLLMALSGWFIASMAISGSFNIAFNYLLPSVGIRILALSRTIGRYLERLITHEASFRMLTELRSWLFQRLEPLSPGRLDDFGNTDILGRLRSDTDSLETLYLRILLPISSGLISIGLATAYVACWSIPAAGILLAALSTNGILLPLLALRLARRPGQQAAALSADLHNSVSKGIIGAEELIIMGAIERQAAEVDRLSADLIQRQRQLGGITAVTTAGGIGVASLASAAILLTTLTELHNGAIAPPDPVMLLLFAAASFEAVATLPASLRQLPETTATIRRILHLADASGVINEPVQAANIKSGTIVFRDCVCQYDRQTPASRINLSIAEGQCLAVTGPSGSGKSSIASILLRFREYSGSVTVGGVELNRFNSEELRQTISAMPQQPHLFNATLRDNITLGNRQASEEQIRQAVSDAALDEWIETLPEGLETRIGQAEGAISGGEGRRITLARALLKDAAILILDEPTEGLDPATEERIVASLSRRLAGRTTLLITHRPACLALADHVLRLD